MLSTLWLIARRVVCAHLQDTGTSAGPPEEETVYDYKYDVADQKWKPWLATIPEFAITKVSVLTRT